jgi:nucleoside-diphosphate-sugar epimerase
MLPLFQWMGRGIAPMPGEPDARFSLLYVEDLCAAVLSWLNAGSCRCGIYELNDTQAGGYSWDEAIARVSVLRARRIIKLPLPAALLKSIALVNVAVARLIGYAPMLTGLRRTMGWGEPGPAAIERLSSQRSDTGQRVNKDAE